MHAQGIQPQWQLCFISQQDKNMTMSTLSQITKDHRTTHVSYDQRIS